MKYALAKPIFFLAIFILVVSLACGISTSEEPAPVENPTVSAPEPVEDVASPVPPPPTDTPAPIYQEFYTEDFTGDTSQWTYFLVDANQPAPLYVEDDFGTMFVGIDNERLVFELESEGQWAYVTYGAFEYEDVRIDVVADNRGVNNNNVSLICRYTETGWYEFNIANNGLYWIYYAEKLDNDKMVYHPIKNGGSNKIKIGKETNEYGIECKGRTLTLYVNGYETISFDENDIVLREGMVGVGVASFDVLPVKVEFDTITISQP
ncbi:MAG TPA: hypothetical protein EYP74_02555 [Anaerolineales bacterium]|nr:hypothetical protein [Anaerolineales bacterium]